MKILLLISSITTVLAAPTLSWTPALGEYYNAIEGHILQAKAAAPSSALQPPTCDLSKAQQPVAPTPLPTPDPSWTLKTVAIGRGVQNYTCSLTSPDVKPVAIGALANLYNVSCIAANYPDILSMLPTLALQYALPADPNANLEPSNLDLIGHHYFTSNNTPAFDLTADAHASLGVTRLKKVGNSTAPADAPKGENGFGDGSVPWLELTTISASSDVVAVYRLNTAGGNPPATCQSSPAAFSVQYASEYWFYTSK